MRAWSYVKYQQMITLIVILILVASPILVADDHHVVGEDGDIDVHPWNVTVTQSNQSWPVLLLYDSVQVFYQNLFLECTIDPRISDYVNLTEKNSSIRISVVDGVFNVSDPSDLLQYMWEGWNEIEEIDKGGIETNSIFLKPQELDFDFSMIVSISIVNESNATMYSEIHHISIIGEPKVIIIDPLYSEIGILRTYVFSLIIGGGIVLFIFWDRKIIGRGI